MSNETLLWLILIATIAIAGLMAPLVAMFHEEMERAKARERTLTVLPLGYVVILLRGVMYVAWFFYASRTDEWLLLAIPVADGIGRFALRMVGKAATRRTEATP